MDSFRCRQRLDVFLRRARVAAGVLLLVFACGASARLLEMNTIPKAAIAVPDEITVLDSRYAKLRPTLPQGQVACFLAKPGISQAEAIDERYTAQYGLAPSLLAQGSNCESFVQLFSQGACVGTRSGQTCETF
jgi:hypothetical protein